MPAVLELYHYLVRFKKNLNAAKPPEQSKGLVGNTLAVRTKTLHGIKRVPQRNHIGSTV